MQYLYFDDYFKEDDASSLLGQPYLLVDVQEAVVITTIAKMANTATTRFIIENFCILFTLLNKTKIVPYI